MRLFLRLFFIVAIWSLVGCEGAAFRKAHEADTIASYREFLRKFPKDENADSATERLSVLEFEQAQSVHTALAYKRFLDEFPESSKAGPAKALLEGLRFNLAQAKNTASAYREFLREHPEGSHATEAARLLSVQEIRDISRMDDLDTLKDAAAHHSEDERGARAEARFDDCSFELARASGAEALLGYLRTFPTGAHRPEARHALFALQIEALLFSGKEGEARRLIDSSPLARGVSDLPRLVDQARDQSRMAQSKDDLVVRLSPQHYLRSLPDFIASLEAPDALDRWQAAEELGQEVTGEALDPLFRRVKSDGNSRVREQAFESLRQILRALPPSIAGYELASRIERLQAESAAEEPNLLLAVMLDLQGHLERAAPEYQRAFDSSFPDPLILSRWVQIRRERAQPFSSAVAARQLALSAQAAAVELATELAPGHALAVSTARALCAADFNAHYAKQAIEEAKAQHTEFPDDVATFEREAVQAARVVDARLADAELLLQTEDPHALTCNDRRVSERISAGEAERLRVLPELAGRLPQTADGLYRWAAMHDPSSQVRAAVQRQLASRGPPAGPR